MKTLLAVYNFFFKRCSGCGKRLPDHLNYCDDECEEEAAFLQIYSF